MARKASSGSVNKAEIIREALKKGIESPAAIAAHAKQTRGLEIDPKYVSVIKSQIRARARGKSARLKNGSIEKAKKALEGVRSDPVLAFAVSLGGVDRAIASLDDLASHI